jgi:cytochrome c biogenesis protein CcmG/thiol:disulfide interchange protein DsbE
MGRQSTAKHHRDPPATRQRGSAANRRGHGTARRVPLVPVALGLIALAGLAAVAVTRSGTTTGAGGSNLAQTRPVRVTGTPLPGFDSSSSSSRPDPAVGRAAPELHGASFDGHPVAVTHGTPTAVVFLAHWCPHCQREVPVLVRWLDAGKLPAGVKLVAVATATSPDVPNYPPSAWLQRLHWPAQVLADDDHGTAATAFGLPAFPYFVLLDGNGHVVARTSGELTPQALDQLFAKLTTGR